MKIYLDDVRDPPINEGWTVARSPMEFWGLVHNGLSGIEAISFDNDLGIGWQEGWELLDRIEDMVINDKEPCPILYVHTANPSAARRMHATIRNIRRHLREAI